MVSKEYDIPLDYDPKLSVYTRSDTRIKWWWSYELPNGERIRRAASNNKTIAMKNGKVKAKQLLKGIFDEKDKEKLGSGSKILLTGQEAVDLYQSLTAPLKSPTTIENEGYWFPAIFGFFSDQRKRRYLSDITQEDIEVYRNLVDQEKSRNTANDYLRCIKKLFNKMAELPYIDEDKNPAANVKYLPPVEEDGEARKVSVPKERLDLILRVPPSPHQTLALWDIIVLIVNTGMRIGEVLHLEWPDINFEKRIIELRNKPNCPTKHGMGWKPKWGKKRKVPLNETALWVLESQPRRETVGFIKNQKDPVPAQFVFPKAIKTGRRRNGPQKVIWARCDEVRHQWKTWLKRAGLFYDGVLMEEFGVPKGSYQIHDLRRTFRQYGTDIALLTENQTSQIMGNDPEVNKKHYGGVVDSEMRNRIENLPFDYRDTSPSSNATPTKARRRKHLRLV